MGEGTELSSSSRRLSTLGRTSSMPRAAPPPPRLGFSKTGGAILPEVETPFSWIWWMTEGSGGATSSVAEENEMLDALFQGFVAHSFYLARSQKTTASVFKGTRK